MKKIESKKYRDTVPLREGKIKSMKNCRVWGAKRVKTGIYLPRMLTGHIFSPGLGTILGTICGLTKTGPGTEKILSFCEKQGSRK
jgi:hypothetical protein